MNWLKDTKYRTLKGVESDNNLTPEQKKILEGIHKRNLSFTVDGPSRTDLSFLDQCYGELYHIVEGCGSQDSNYGE